MKLTARLTVEILLAARACVKGHCAQFEAGIRETDQPAVMSANMRMWAPDADLFDTVPLARLGEVPADASGKVLLDLYAYTGRGYDWELECNVYVLIGAEGVIRATDKDSEIPSLLA